MVSKKTQKRKKKLDAPPNQETKLITRRQARHSARLKCFFFFKLCYFANWKISLKGFFLDFLFIAEL
jgi:hypothetical protein